MGTQKSRRLTLGVMIIVILGVLGLASKRWLGQPAPAMEPVFQSSSVTGPEVKTPAPPNPCGDFHKSFCTLQKGDIRDPTGLVKSDATGEKQALALYQQLIKDHPHWTSDQVDEELSKTIYSARRRDRFLSAFRWVRTTLERFIDRQPGEVFSPSEKAALKKRLRKTELQLPPPASIYSDEPDLFTKSDVYYERITTGQTRMRVGGAYLLTAKSWFNIIFTLAHEFGHAIDPCELRAANLSIPSYDRLTACFMKKGLVAIRKNRAECGENDQLSETFADWMAVQVAGEALASFATEFHGQQLFNAAVNSVRDLCEQPDSLEQLDFEYHPTPEVRINKIFGENPKIREILGCAALPAGKEYCQLDSR